MAGKRRRKMSRREKGAAIDKGIKAAGVAKKALLKIKEDDKIKCLTVITKHLNLGGVGSGPRW